MYASEKASGSRNRAIAYMLQSFGVPDDDPNDVLDVYFRQCSFNVTATGLARMAATLARGGVNPMTGRRVTNAAVVRRTLSVMVTRGMYDAAGDWVSAVGMPAKSGVGGGIVAVLPGQLGIGVYSPLLDGKGNSVRGVRVCRSMSEQLGLHFLNVARDSRASLRAVYEPCDNVRVYETQGDLLFCGAEQMVRTMDRERKAFDVAILDVSRVEIDDAARALLSGMSAALRTQGKDGYLVDPNGIVLSSAPELEAVRYRTVDDAVTAARVAVRGGVSG
ncbi:MAG: Glutaminase [Mycobacterium sp.]|nr:Glutaminase [Mycobacterium sp.]